jgi:hypothetical protein
MLQLAFLVQRQQFSVVPLTGFIVNQQIWDSGGDLYLFDGCQSQNGVINWEDKQLVWHNGRVTLTWWQKIKQLIVLVACSLNEAAIIGIADNSKLDPSKSAILWFPDYCDGEAGINSGDWKDLQWLIAESMFRSKDLLLLGTSVVVTKIKVQAADKLYPSPIAEIFVRSQAVLLAAFFLEIKTNHKIDIKYLQVLWDPG